jgi:hypothetical protein
MAEDRTTKSLQFIVNSSNRRPATVRPRDRFFDEKYRMLGHGGPDRVRLGNGAVLQTLTCSVFGMSLMGIGSIMADGQPAVGSVDVPGGQPLEPVVDGVPGLLAAPKEGALAAPVPVPFDPGKITGAETALPAVSPPALPTGPGLEAGPGTDGLVPLDAAAMEASAAGTAALMPAGSAAEGVAAEAGDAGMDGAREVSRELLDDAQDRANARPWTFSVTGGVMYDDNVQIQQAGGDQKSDIILSGGFNSSYAMRSGSIVESLNGVVGGSYMSYLENSEFSGWNGNAGLTGAIRYGDFAGSVNVTAGQVNGANRLVGGFSVNRNYLAAVTGNYEISEKTRVTASVNLNVMDFVQQSYQAQQFNGNSTLSASVGANYAVTAKTRLGANYMWSEAKQEAFSSWGFSSINATAEWQATAKTGFTGSVGRQVSSLDGVEAGDGPGWIGSLTGNWQASDRMALRVGFTRSAAAAAVGGNGSMNFNTINFGLTRTVTDRLTGSLQVNYRMDDYQDLDGGDEFQGRESSFWSIGAGLTWRISTRAMLGATYDFQDNNSNFGGWNFSANRVGMNFAYSF